MIGPVSPFTIAQIAIAGDDKHLGASELRLSAPPPHGDGSGLDLQGRFTNKDGASFWITIVTFPRRETPPMRPVRDKDMPPFPGPFGLRGGFEWR